MSHGRRVPLACVHCDEVFTRRLVDLGRGLKGPFCSKACHASSMRTGRRMLEVVCSGCGVGFRKLPSEAKRTGRRRHYCSVPCYLATVDWRALVRMGASAPRTPPPRAARFLRSQKAGLARARNLSPERLREIAMKGVAARLAKGASRGPGSRRVAAREVRAGLDWVAPLLTREGVDG